MQLTSSNEKRKSFHGIGMRSLLSLQPVQRCPADLARLHGCFTVLGQVLTRRSVMIESQADLCATSAHQSECYEVVGDQVAGGMVGDALGALGGTETERRQNSPTAIC